MNDYRYLLTCPKCGGDHFEIVLLDGKGTYREDWSAICIQCREEI